MDFYTAVLKPGEDYWLALCLENALVGQGESKDKAIIKLKEAIDSFAEILKTEDSIYHSPISIKELHEFLFFEKSIALSESFELRSMSA